ncbi:uncharacterized protein LOC126799283 [Argentina anserina]|uniref:uncharacterized protein LOC126799283 n=1 Tax=Argentina anserina TaxID=57926 RepID=UPI0021764447|nr:uncharacterized protein LOC126799283 [Potentilla anserina]XP_050382409.1 uncharacterized protein LOC126799283 [Potentilla anserina]
MFVGNELQIKKFASFTIINPESNHIQDNDHDGGIYVIRHMQYYNNRWYEGFNFVDQRKQLALEIVKNPLNEVHAAVNITITTHYLESNDQGLMNCGNCLQQRSLNTMGHANIGIIEEGVKLAF